MTLQEWQELAPADAARLLHAQVQRLSPAQHRAMLVAVRSQPELAAEFEAAGARRDAPLARVPYLVKDLFDVRGWPTFAGSTFLPEVRPAGTSDAALVEALGAAGAVVAGKSQMHEFAYGITGENAHYGDCEHPRFPGRTTGGSSSGSAAAVAAGIVPLALGTDTGGSVRLPAAFCGLYGFRLTPGDRFIRDAVALAPSLDTAGWFTRTAPDLRAVNAALVPSQRLPGTPRGCYLELPGLDHEVSVACRAAADALGAECEADTTQALQAGFAPALDAYNILVAHEAWDVHRPWAERQRERYSPAVWQRLIRGQALTPAQVEAAERQRAAIRALWSRFFEKHDFLALPASPSAALTKAECTLENRNRILVLTAPASLGGLPVVTLPVKLSGGLTTGLQIVVKDPASPVVDWALRHHET